MAETKAPASKDNKDDSSSVSEVPSQPPLWNLPLVMNIVKTGFTVCQPPRGRNQQFLNHILCKSSLVRCGTDQLIDFPISLRFNNMTLIHSFISVLNAALLGHRPGIINNQIRSLIESRSRVS